MAYQLWLYLMRKKLWISLKRILYEAIEGRVRIKPLNMENKIIFARVDERFILSCQFVNVC